MKKIYSKFLRTQVELQMKSALPQFEAIDLRLSRSERTKSTLVPGETALVERIREDFWLLVSYFPDRTQERLRLDAGWSRRGRFPFDITRPTWSRVEVNLPDESLEEALYSYSEYLLFGTGNGVFIGWNVWTCSVAPDHPDYRRIFVQEDLASVPEAIAEQRVRSAVKSAVADFQSVVLPQILRVAELTGTK